MVAENFAVAISSRLLLRELLGHVDPRWWSVVQSFREFRSVEGAVYVRPVLSIDAAEYVVGVSQRF